MKRSTVIALALFGGLLLWWPFSDDRELSWCRRELSVSKNQLSGLAEAIRAYKTQHGRYPSNDEGLAVLQGFDSTILVSFITNVAKGATFIDAVRDERMWWPHSSYDIERFRQGHGGRAPTNESEFEDAGLGTMATSLELALTPAFAEIAIDKSNNVFAMDTSGILSPWGLPYLYENRSGHDCAHFSCSPVAKDGRGYYSVMVDSNVYVYCVGSIYNSQCFSLLWETRYLPQCVGAILVAVALLLLIIGKGKHAISFILSFVVGTGFGGMMSAAGYSATCYIPTAFHRRDPRAVTKQVELIEQYHANGVINDQTYRRLMEATKGQEHGSAQ